MQSFKWLSRFSFFLHERRKVGHKQTGNAKVIYLSMWPPHWNTALHIQEIPWLLEWLGYAANKIQSHFFFFFNLPIHTNRKRQPRKFKRESFLAFYTLNGTSHYFLCPCWTFFTKFYFPSIERWIAEEKKCFGARQSEGMTQGGKLSWAPTSASNKTACIVPKEKKIQVSCSESYSNIAILPPKKCYFTSYNIVIHTVMTCV